MDVDPLLSGVGRLESGLTICETQNPLGELFREAHFYISCLFCFFEKFLLSFL